MTEFPNYKSGTVSVNTGDTVIAGSIDAIWTDGNARAGDDIVIRGHTVIVEDVIDATHLAIDAWPYANVPAGTSYKILQRSPLRYAGGQAAADVIKLVAALNTESLPVIVPPTATAPDPSLGEEDQYAVQPGAYKFWLKTGGLWVFQGIYKGFQLKGAWNAVDSFALNDVVSQGGSSYAAIAPSTNKQPPNADYWMVLAAKGDPGTDGAPGATGATGAGYRATSATSLIIGAGARTFATQVGLAYAAGARARASSNANGANFMEGLVTAYAGDSLTINITKTGGAGTFADWNINVAGDPGSGDLLSSNNLADVGNTNTALNNLHGVNYNAVQALNAAQQAQARANISAGASPAARTRTVLTSGSGTYNVPAGCKAILVRMAGGGGGGAGSGNGASGGGNGGVTTFSNGGTISLTASGGGGGGVIAGGGNPSGASGGDINLTGGYGGGSVNGSNTAGGSGGNTVFGGGPGPQASGNPGNPGAAPGAGGGGGAGGNNGWSGAGGGAAGYCEKLITNPTGPFNYSVAAGGTAGAVSGSNGQPGAAGGPGIIIIDEFY
jgi:hypothetical protein